AAPGLRGTFRDSRKSAASGNRLPPPSLGGRPSNCPFRPGVWRALRRSLQAGRLSSPDSKKTGPSRDRHFSKLIGFRQGLRLLAQLLRRFFGSSQTHVPASGKEPGKQAVVHGRLDKPTQSALGQRLHSESAVKISRYLGKKLLG